MKRNQHRHIAGTFIGTERHKSAHPAKPKSAHNGTLPFRGVPMCRLSASRSASVPTGHEQWRHEHCFSFTPRLIAWLSAECGLSRMSNMGHEEGHFAGHSGQFAPARCPAGGTFGDITL